MTLVSILQTYYDAYNNLLTANNPPVGLDMQGIFDHKRKYRNRIFANIEVTNFLFGNGYIEPTINTQSLLAIGMDEGKIESFIEECTQIKINTLTLFPTIVLQKKLVNNEYMVWIEILTNIRAMTITVPSSLTDAQILVIATTEHQKMLGL
jgi:hypothetical protein